MEIGILNFKTALDYCWDCTQYALGNRKFSKHYKHGTWRTVGSSILDIKTFKRQIIEINHNYRWKRGGYHCSRQFRNTIDDELSFNPWGIIPWGISKLTPSRIFFKFWAREKRIGFNIN